MCPDFTNPDLEIGKSKSEKFDFDLPEANEKVRVKLPKKSMSGILEVKPVKK